MTKKKNTKNYKWVDEELKYIKESEGKDPSTDLQARTKRFVKQYEKQGWSDMDTWNLDSRFAEWIVPRLRRFIELHNGYPGGLTEKKWKEMLDEMLEGFEFMASEDWYGSCEIKKQEKAAKALKLFGEWAPHLWW
jgi:hypothetical protein